MGGAFRIGLCLTGLGLALAGCSGESLPQSWFNNTPNATIPHPAPPTQESDKIIKLPAGPGDVDCPPIDVFDGGATARTGGPDSQSVRYQFDISDTARQCMPQGAQFALTIGVRGRLLIGPAGSPGTYSTALHVEVRREVDDKVMFQKTYAVSASTNGGAQGAFQVLTDPIMLPLTRARLDEDYEISVGLGAGAPVSHHVRRHRRS